MISTKEEKKRYLFIHGSYHGAWCWDDIAKQLNSYNHDTYSVDTSINTLKDINPNNFTWNTYVDHVLEYIRSKQLSDLTVVAHSSGGVIASLLLDRIPDVIESIVFTSAMILDQGERFFDFLPKTVEDRYMSIARSNRGLITLNESVFKTALANATSSEPLLNSFFSRLVPQPVQPYTQPVSLNNFRKGKVPMTYIKFTQDISLGPDKFSTILSKLPSSAKSFELDADHEVFLSNPSGLVQLLLQV